MPVTHESFVDLLAPHAHTLWMATRPKEKPKKTKEALLAGARLRECRDKAGLNQRELAEKSGVFTKEGISNYEQGLRHLNIRAAKILAPLINSHAAYLMGLITDVELRVLLAFHAGNASPPSSGGSEHNEDERPFRRIRRVAVDPGLPENSRSHPY